MSKDWTKIRAKVKDFIESEIYPKENDLAQERLNQENF